MIAYEPKWAIGTGKVASPDQAEEAHFACRMWLGVNANEEVASSTRIIYGGSVNAKNCATLIACPNIDGFLVGGASLTADFVTIIQVSRIYELINKIKSYNYNLIWCKKWKENNIYLIVCLNSLHENTFYFATLYI